MHISYFKYSEQKRQIRPQRVSTVMFFREICYEFRILSPLTVTKCNLHYFLLAQIFQNNE